MHIATVLLAAHRHDVDFSLAGLLVGLVVAAIVYFVCVAVADHTATPIWRTIGIIAALIIVLVCAFDVAGVG